MNAQILVIGDVMLDRYVWGVTGRPNPEVPGGSVFRVDRIEDRLGGAGAVAFLCAGLGADVTLCGCVGLDAEGDALTSLCTDNGIKWRGYHKQSFTTLKQRYVEDGALLGMRVDRDCDSAADACDPALWIHDEHFNCVVVSDYARGFTSDGLVRSLSRRFPGIPIIVDPARDRDWRAYHGATVIKCNEFEARRARKLRGCRLVVTRKGDGMKLDGKMIPTLRRPVVDPAGCGDTVAAVLALYLSRGQALAAGCRMANIAAGLQVGRLGVQQVSWAEINLTDCKMAGQETVIAFAQLKKAAGRRVVFTNGCFDVLHAGHVELLRRASALGDVLIVGLNSDSSVKRLKGESRPVHNQARRAAVLAALECVHALTVFDDEPTELVKAIGPDVMVKGEDYRGRPISGGEFAGHIELIPLVDGLSVTVHAPGSSEGAG